MNKVKAIIYTITLFVLIFGLLILSMNVEFKYGINLFHCITSFLSGRLIGEKMIHFYKLLIKNN